ncbi:hypothetical protein P5667_11915 [Bacillus velezensis]|uniref:hypothetical protein n=1 Tax=Bacillus amyloliquefaciens group TaxID=1938374 RepID=UPI000DEBD646|nr:MULTISPECIES: hypothetical protein [Bacillus amyloliquefaciens group]MCP9020118.1 hypothetical protein [Bacillus velezensis]MDE5154235.1 hypothetical protein [Bacillus amyloliquefaciens]MDH3086612.1 hypothetical protein [Bacillus velezensis]MDM5216801.1 hypothetical protein [Bacillus velezensis]QTG83473.1 hypothetical protein J4048_10860 [Bacillus amyloliquefaciens]
MDFNLEIDLKDIIRSVSMSVGSKNIQSGEYYIDIIFKNNGDCLRIRMDHASVLEFRDKINETLWKLDGMKTFMKTAALQYE